MVNMAISVNKKKELSFIVIDLSFAEFRCLFIFGITLSCGLIAGSLKLLIPTIRR